MEIKNLVRCNGRLLFLTRAIGTLSDHTLEADMAAIHEIESTCHVPFDRVFDARYVTEVRMRPPFVVARALNRRKTHEHRPEFKTAIIGTHPQIIELSEVSALIYEGSNIDFERFDTLIEAASWLKCPEDFLENRLRAL